MPGSDPVGGAVAANPAVRARKDGIDTANAAEAGGPRLGKREFVCFEEYFAADVKRLVALLVKLGATSHDAADIAQDVLIDVYRRWDKIDSPRDWATCAAVARCYRTPSSGKHETLVEAVPDSCHSILIDPEFYADVVESADRVRVILAPLSEQQRLVMAFLSEGYNQRETARLINTTPAAVAQTARRARGILKDHILAARQAKEDR
jgi:RNA polymerase sigma factor (sigma-70 family)